MPYAFVTTTLNGGLVGKTCTGYAGGSPDFMIIDRSTIAVEVMRACSLLAA